MDSEDSGDGSRAKSSSSSSSSSSRSQRSSSSDRSTSSKKGPKSPPRSPPRSPPQSPPSISGGQRSPDSQSQSSNRSLSPNKPPRSPDNLSGAHSDINSPENSVLSSPAGPKSPDGPKSPSEAGSNIGSPNREQYSAPSGPGAKTPQSPSSARSGPTCLSGRARPASPDSVSQPNSPPPTNTVTRSRTSSPTGRNVQTSPVRAPELWRRHTKAEQKMVPVLRNRSRSESSQSSRSSSYNKRSNMNDPATEEISEGEMESDQEDRKSGCKSVNSEKHDGKELNISHEDLSDVSDLDSGAEDNQKDEKPISSPASSERKQETKVNGSENGSIQTSPKSNKIDTPKLEKLPQEKTSNTEVCEEQLDFEAEEGECIEPNTKEHSNGDAEAQSNEKDEKPGRRSRGSSLEEGEVSDEGERRPEESEPRPVCRFFARGACTWGISCRFLHPGVTDKGNYNMFDVVRGVPASGSYNSGPPRDVAPPESAWERGLRTAKEMLRIANKRKEQDMDFEEKKLHLSVGGIVHDPDAELAYAAAAVGASPPPPHHHELAPPHRDPEMFRPGPYGPMYRGRGFTRPGMEERERFYERERLYERERERERVYERPPAYEERPPPVTDDMGYHKRRIRPSREVIVQRAEVERREAREPRERETRRDGREGGGREGREGRGDEWADPWMRAEPAARRRRAPSSDDSYSSSSSHSSRSPGERRKRRASSSSRQRLSPSVIVRERRMATARATAMNPPAPRRRAPSPNAARQLAVNPPPPASHRHKDEVDPYGRTKPPGRNKKKYSKSSSSGSESSSSSSESESDSHSSSTSGSSGAKRARHARLLNAAARPRMNAKTAGLAAAVTIPNKKETLNEKDASKKRVAGSPPDSAPAKKPASRREELLKQLKAVEDAIARKRSKI